jgi:hypothetical protein
VTPNPEGIMKMRSIVLGVLILSACGIGSATAQAIPVIFDTDMGNDIDDALALAMLHAFESRGEVRIREEGGLHRYLKLGSDAQSHRAVEAMVYLASQPPTR